jgi:hypothetical protein
MRSLALTLVLGLLAVTVGGASTGASPASTTPSEYRLADAAPSIDTLLEEFRLALETKDKDLLRQLRVNRTEYLDIIMPGSVDEGQPRATYDKTAKNYFWGILNGKSIYVEANLLYAFGGKPLKVTAIEYRRGIKRYRDYTAYKQLMLTIDDGSGNEPEQMKIGSIAEVNGQYKFISYVRD